MKSTNPLDVLFRDIQNQLAAEARKPLPPPHLHRQSTYANPENWRLGKVVRLVHIDEGSLGVFQEYFHKLSPTARRLLPAAEGLPVDRDELVFGDWWLHPKFQAAPEPESDLEVLAIWKRFNELMDLEDNL